MQKSENKLTLTFGLISILIGSLNLFLGLLMFYEVPRTLYLLMPIFHHTISQIAFGVFEVLAGNYLIRKNINALTIISGLAIMLIINSICCFFLDGIDYFLVPIVRLLSGILILVLIQIFKNKVSLSTGKEKISMKFIYITSIVIGSGIPILLRNVNWR